MASIIFATLEFISAVVDIIFANVKIVHTLQ